MTVLVIALLVFVVLHSVPAIPAVRARLIAAIGRPAHFGIYSLVSLAVLGWVFHAALHIDYVPLWETASWQTYLALILSPFGLFFVLAGLLSANPLSISIRQGRKAGAIVAISRHPVHAGFLLWSFAHLLVNGDLRSLILFGGFAAFSLASLPMMEKRARKRLGPAWPEDKARTSILPFAAILAGRARFSIDRPMLLAAILAALGTLWLLAGGHAALFGADPLLLL